MGIGAGLEASEKKLISSACLESIHDSTVVFEWIAVRKLGCSARIVTVLRTVLFGGARVELSWLRPACGGAAVTTRAATFPNIFHPA
jgi:hypothetical protein